MRVSAQKLLLRRFRFRGVALGVLAAEALHAPGGVHELLLAGKEWVAGGTDFYADVALVGRASDKRVPAGAMHADLAVVGMDSCFHVSSESSTQTLDSTGVRKDSARQDWSLVVSRLSLASPANDETAASIADSERQTTNDQRLVSGLRKTSRLLSLESRTWDLAPKT